MGEPAPLLYSLWWSKHEADKEQGPVDMHMRKSYSPDGHIDMYIYTHTQRYDR